EITFLDEVGQWKPAIEIAPRDLHDEAKVRLDHLILGCLVPGPDALGQLVLLFPGQERDASDLVEIDAEVGPAGVSRFLPDVLVDGVDRRLQRLVGNPRVELGGVTHRRAGRTPLRAGQSEGAAAADTGGCRTDRSAGFRSGDGATSRGRSGPRWRRSLHARRN